MASAAILAGGASRRFGGRDKSALIVEGRSILERQIEELSYLTDDILLVKASTGRPGDARLRVVADRVPGSGPLGGLEAALTAARDDSLLLLACDMPFVTAPFLSYLLELAPEADVVVPKTERGYHPLCAVYSRACHPPVARRLAARCLQIGALFDDVQVRAVTGDEIGRFGSIERLLANVNTQAEFDELETLLGHKL